MPNEYVIAKAREFLEVVGGEVQAKFGDTPRATQVAVWWSEAGPGDSRVTVRSRGSSTTLRIGRHEREVFAWDGVNAFYQNDLSRRDFPEQTELHDAITAAGFDAQGIRFQLLIPLVLAWCRLPEPFDLARPAAQALLDEFAEAVTGGLTSTKYRDAIVSLDIDGTPIVLQEGVTIRPINEEELWELGSWTLPTPPFSLQLVPTENWSILDIEVRHRQDETEQTGTTLYALREAVIADFAIGVDGGFMLLPIGMTAQFGPNAMATTTYGSRMPREFGPFPGKRTVAIDATAKQRLQDMWPRVKEIMLSSSHYLGLPLRRLIDGLGRTRLDDRIVDYAIALEALLIPEKDELRYRFALRGAAVLEDQGENRDRVFHDLQNFYDARSTIVHGGSVAKLNLRTLADIGEHLLRKIWKWYLDQRLTKTGAIARIDRRILGPKDE